MTASREITRGNRARHNCARKILTSIAVTIAVAALLPAAALAGTTRPYEGSFASFPNTDLKTVAVDQSNGDLYVAYGSVVRRFDSAGEPKNFTEGPDAGTNILTGFVSANAVAVDNSNGPLQGTVYVADGLNSTASIEAFSVSGTSLGSITEAGAPAGQTEAEKGAPPTHLYNPCGISVDPANGDLYVSEFIPAANAGGLGAHIWRYSLASPSGQIDRSDYTLTGIQVAEPCSLAANSGDLYAVLGVNAAATLRKFSATDFTANFQATPTGEEISADSHPITGVAVDTKTGEVFANEMDRVTVFDPTGNPLYWFGASAYFGSLALSGDRSSGIAIMSAPSGPASKVFVADRQIDDEVDVFGPQGLAPYYVHRELTAFGSDGTSATEILGRALTFDRTRDRLYASSPSSSGGVYGFDTSLAPTYTPLAAFSPLPTVGLGQRGGVIAVDGAEAGSTGNVYFTGSNHLLYGFSATGAPLAGFPVDPAVSPGAPDGSPRVLCGVATDMAGNVWVTNTATKRALQYSPTGSYLGSVDLAATTGTPCALAFDSNGDLYVDGGGVWRYEAADSYTTPVRVIEGNNIDSIAIDRTNHHLYVTYPAWVDVFDMSGNLIDEFATRLGGTRSTALDEDSELIYVAGEKPSKIRVFGPPILLPETATRPVSSIANHSVTLNGTVSNQGVALTECHFEYVSEAAFLASGFDDLSSGGSAPCVPVPSSIPLDLEAHPVSGGASGLETDTRYRFRLVASNADGDAESSDARFASAGPPLVETVGSPVRTATAAQLQGRLDPVRVATTYHFEYGSEGPCDSNPCTSTEPLAAGSGDVTQLVAQTVEGLEPGTLYHYRLIADNGNADGPAVGGEMTLQTRATDAPLTHGHFPGPPESDRAWEQVGQSDSGGNPIRDALGFASGGERALYRVSGGTPVSESGSFAGIYYAQRQATGEHVGGWQTELIAPARDLLVGPDWPSVVVTDDLSTVVAKNQPVVAGSVPPAIWRFGSGLTATKLLQAVAPLQESSLSGTSGGFFTASRGSGRAVALLKGGTPDPSYPAASARSNLYDISSGTPELLSLLPGNVVSDCEMSSVPSSSFGNTFDEQKINLVSADGELLFFPSGGSDCGQSPQLYVRDIEAGTTALIGPGTLLKSTPDAAFFLTSSNLEAGDTGGADVYRYELEGGETTCVTCVVDGVQAAVIGKNADQVIVADDGSRVYFKSENKLVEGAPEAGGGYRVEVASGDIAYVPMGEVKAVSADGRYLAFRSNDSSLDLLNGETNNSSNQYFLYDDATHALNCVSCPADGSAPRSSVSGRIAVGDDGTAVFKTTSSLATPDQNTAPSGAVAESGADVYEWRDGQRLLVTDGLTNWSVTGLGEDGGPEAWGVGASGQDVLFTAPAQYTPDALDGYNRLYDARIDGGFEFPPPPKPCPLEVCQGTPKGAPEEAAPGTGALSGPGNLTHTPARRACPKGKARRGSRCVKKSHKRQSHKKRNRQANRDGRASK